MLTLAVPKPSQTYRASVRFCNHVHIVSLTLHVTALGEKLPYKVCWQLRLESGAVSQGLSQVLMECRGAGSPTLLALGRTLAQPASSGERDAVFERRHARHVPSEFVRAFIPRSRTLS